MALLSFDLVVSLTLLSLDLAMSTIILSFDLAVLRHDFLVSLEILNGEYLREFFIRKHILCVNPCPRGRCLMEKIQVHKIVLSLIPLILLRCLTAVTMAKKEFHFFWCKFFYVEGG